MPEFNFKKIRGVFFDLYGTVLVFDDEEKASREWRKTYYELAGRQNNLSQEEINIICDELMQSNVVKDKDSGLTTYETKIKQSFEKRGVTFSGEQLGLLADETVEVWQKYISIAPDAVDVFTRLKKKVKLAMITNFDHSRHIRNVIKKYHLDSFLDPIIISDEAGCQKPDPKIFELALQQTKLNAGEIIFVGDSSDDVNGALLSKIEPIIIKYPKSRNSVNIDVEIQKSIITINSLADLINLLNYN